MLDRFKDLVSLAIEKALEMLFKTLCIFELPMIEYSLEQEPLLIMLMLSFDIMD